jgi:two-component system, OmpR family, response regulator RegX3
MTSSTLTLSLPRIPLGARMTDHTTPPKPSPLAAADYMPVAPQTLGRLRVLTIGTIELNLDGKAARIGGQPVHMAPKEFDLLATLMDNAGRMLTRRELLDAVWEPGYPDRNKTLDVHIRRLRGHLAADPDANARLRTVRGHGYVFDLGEWADPASARRPVTGLEGQ